PAGQAADERSPLPNPWAETVRIVAAASERPTRSERVAAWPSLALWMRRILKKSRAAFSWLGEHSSALFGEIGLGRAFASARTSTYFTSWRRLKYSSMTWR